MNQKKRANSIINEIAIQMCKNINSEQKNDSSFSQSQTNNKRDALFNLISTPYRKQTLKTQIFKDVLIDLTRNKLTQSSPKVKATPSTSTYTPADYTQDQLKNPISSCSKSKLFQQLTKRRTQVLSNNQLKNLNFKCVLDYRESLQEQCGFITSFGSPHYIGPTQEIEQIQNQQIQIKGLDKFQEWVDKNNLKQKKLFLRQKQLETEI